MMRTRLRLLAGHTYKTTSLLLILPFEMLVAIRTRPWRWRDRVRRLKRVCDDTVHVCEVPQSWFSLSLLTDSKISDCL